MSYDIRFGVKVAGANDDVFAVIGHPEYDSPTYNVGTIFRKCMDFDFEQGKWYPANEILPNIKRGICELKFNAKKYKVYEPENGWGSTSTALESLESIWDWFSDDKWFLRGWNADIPIGCIYIAW